MSTPKIELELKQRFVKDHSLPIPVLQEPWFTYFLELYEDYNGALSKWRLLWDEINSRHSGSPGKYLDSYYQDRNNIIVDLENSESYKSFISDPDFFEKFKSDIPGKRKTDLYTSNNIGKIFLQIDLKKANFQALKFYDSQLRIDHIEIPYYLEKLNELEKKLYTWKYKILGKKFGKKIDVKISQKIQEIKDILGNLKKYDRYKGILKGAETYPDFIGKWSWSENLISSKYTRQVIFGKLNPKRQITIEEYLISKIFSLISSKINGELFNVVTDELIFKLPNIPENKKELVDNIINEISINLGLEVSCTIFTLSEIQMFTSEGSSILGFIKDYKYPELPKSIHKVPGNYFAQLFKTWKGLEIDKERDLYFTHEGQVTKYEYPLWQKS